MSEEIDFANLPDFPKRVSEKLKTIRKRLNLSPDQIAPRVGAKSGADILEYETNSGTHSYCRPKVDHNYSIRKRFNRD